MGNIQEPEEMDRRAADWIADLLLCSVHNCGRDDGDCNVSPGCDRTDGSEAGTKGGIEQRIATGAAKVR